MKNILSIKMVSIFLCIAAFSNAAYSDIKLGSSREASMAILRQALDKAAQKYYQVSLIQLINKKVFKDKLETGDEAELERLMLFAGTAENINLLKRLQKKYAKYVNTEDSDLDEIMTDKINKLYFLKDVQAELINTIYSAQAKVIAGKYIETVKAEELHLADQIISKKWNGSQNFQKALSKIKFFWPSLAELETSFMATKLNGLPALTLDKGDLENSPNLPKKYQPYTQAGFTFYTAINSSLGLIDDAEKTFFLFLNPTVFYGTPDPQNFTSAAEINFALVGVLGHEFGHAVAYPADDNAALEFAKISDAEVAETERTVFLPFFDCYAGPSQKYAIETTRSQLGEARADAISYIVQKSLYTKWGVTQPQSFNLLIETLKLGAAGENEDGYDPHPTLKVREAILNGKCQMKEIPGFFNYTDLGLDKGVN